MKMWPLKHRQCPACALVAQWPNYDIWWGGENKSLFHLKVCGDCSKTHAGGFTAFCKTTSTIHWASDTDKGQFLCNDFGRLFNIADQLWGALIGACDEQVACWGTTMSSILIVMDSESQDRLEGKVKTEMEPWMVRKVAWSEGSSSLLATRYADPASSSAQAVPFGTAPPAPPSMDD